MKRMRGSYSISLLLTSGAYALFVLALAYAAAQAGGKIDGQAAVEKGLGRLETACIIVDSLAGARYSAAGEFEELRGISFHGRTALLNVSLAGNKLLLLKKECIASSSGGSLLRTGLE